MGTCERARAIPPAPITRSPREAHDITHSQSLGPIAQTCTWVAYVRVPSKRPSLLPPPRLPRAPHLVVVLHLAHVADRRGTARAPGALAGRVLLGLGGFHRHRAFEEVARGTLQNLGKISLQQAIAQARS